MLSPPADAITPILANSPAWLVNGNSGMSNARRKRVHLSMFTCLGVSFAREDSGLTRAEVIFAVWDVIID